MKSALSLAAAAIAAAIIGALSYQAIHERNNEYKPAERLPAFSLNDMHGTPRQSSEWQGKTLLINFWATWCPPCRKEIPLLIDAQNRYADQGLQVIGIALEQAEPVRKYAKEMGINYPSLAGSADVIDLGNRLGNQIGALPFTVMINADGKVLDTHMGELTLSELEALIAAAL
jgi:thiol-disulfide isomerase/thioredoxin